MADAPKDEKGKGDDKKSSGGGGGMSDVTFFLLFFAVLFILWIATGGPSRNSSSRTNQFITPSGQTYHDSVFEKPGSVTTGVGL
jgi:hypothetical protein